MSPQKIILFPLLLFTCFGCYSPPNSPLVNIVGKDLNNFIDMTKHQKDTLALSGNYQLLYLRKTHEEYEKPDDKGDKAFLILEDIETNKKEILFEGHLGYDIDYAFFVPHEKSVLFTLENARKSEDKTYLYKYDLLKKMVILKYVLLDKSKYKDPDIFLGGIAYILELHFNENGQEFYLKVNHQKSSGEFGLYDYFIFDLGYGSKTKISSQKFEKLKNSIESNHTYGYSYLIEKRNLRLFAIIPHSDYSPSNYKHKYNGVYVNDGKNNIRISRINGYEIMGGSPPIWIEGGSKIISGGYLFDVEGVHREQKLVDGKILSVFKK